MRKKIYLLALFVNAIGWGAGNLLVILGKVEFGQFDFGMQFVILFSVFTSVYFYRKDNISWFGRHLESSHSVNKIMSQMFAIFALIPAAFFNLSPWIDIFST